MYSYTFQGRRASCRGSILEESVSCSGVRESETYCGHPECAEGSSSGQERQCLLFFLVIRGVILSEKVTKPFAVKGSWNELDCHTSREGHPRRRVAGEKRQGFVTSLTPFGSILATTFSLSRCLASIFVMAVGSLVSGVPAIRVRRGCSVRWVCPRDGDSTPTVEVDGSRIFAFYLAVHSHLL